MVHHSAALPDNDICTLTGHHSRALHGLLPVTSSLEPHNTGTAVPISQLREGECHVENSQASGLELGSHPACSIVSDQSRSG